MDGETAENANLLEKLHWGAENLPVRQRQVCSYLLKNHQQVVFMTVEEVAKNSGLSPSTVVRAVSGLGFESYHSLQQALQGLLLRSKVSLWWQLEDSWGGTPAEPEGRTGEGNGYAGTHSLRAQLRDSWDGNASMEPENANHPLVVATRDNVESLTQLMTPLVFENFEKAVNLIEKSRRLFLLGTRSSQGIARYGFSLLHQFMSNVYMADRSGTEEMFDDLIDLGEGDCILALSYGGPHYASRTLDALQIAHSMGIPIILMTTELSNPAVPMAEVVLCVSSGRRHYTTAPALTLIEAFVIELGKRFRAPAMKKLRKLEKILGEKNVTL